MICVISDTHGDMSRFSHKKIKALKKDDVLMICGDFGFVWDGSDKEKALLKKIGSAKYTTLFIGGSHDNYDLLTACPEEDFMGGRARNISGRLWMLSSGSVFSICGKSVFVFGGGQGDPDFCAPWENELADEALLENGRKNLAEHCSSHGPVDCIFTHEPPAVLTRSLSADGSAPLLGRLNYFFDDLKNEADFRLWCFGRLHMNKAVPPKYRAVFDEPYIIE